MSTVRVLSTSSPAISRFVRPEATRRITSSSRRERPALSWLGRRAPPEPPLDRLAELRDLVGRLGGQRRGAEAARREVRLARTARPRPRARPAAASATPARSWICARSNGISRPSCSSAARASCCAAASAWPSASAVSPSACASAARASGWPVVGGDARQRLGAGARLAERAVAGEEARRPAKAPDRVVVVLAALPALQQEAAVRAGVVEVALVLRRARRARRRCPRSSRPRRGARPCRGTGRAAAGRPTTRRGRRGSIRARRPPPAWRPALAPGRRSSSRELRGALPVAQLAQHVGHAAEARVLHAVGAARLAEADRGGERIARAAVVARDLVGRAEPLVDLRRLERELVLERQREPGPDRLHPRRRTPRPSRARRPGARGPARADRCARRAPASSPARRVSSTASPCLPALCR